MNHEKLLFYIISLFMFWGFWSWFVFLNSLSVLWFSFVFFLYVFPLWDVYFCFGICISVFWYFFSVLGLLYPFLLHWRHPKKKETVFALCFRLLNVASGAINYPARIGIHFYAWCTKNSSRKEIRSFHNTENSYCITLKRTMHNINNIITWNFQGAVKPPVGDHCKG